MAGPNLKPQSFDIVEDTDRLFRLRVSVPSEWAWRSCVPLSGLLTAALVWLLGVESGELLMLIFVAALGLTLPLSTRLSFLRRTEEYVVDADGDQLLKRTASKVLPETVLCRLSELEHVRLTHQLSGPSSPGSGSGEKRDAHCLTFRLKTDHPDAAETQITHATRASDAGYLRALGQRLADAAEVAFLDEAS